MSVDVSALIALTVERAIPLEKMISAIENAVTEKYLELEVAKPQGRAVLNRDTGDIKIHVPIFDEEGIYKETVTDSPEGFDQVIASVTRKEIKQRMRAANDAGVVEEFSANVGEVISGVIQQGRDATIVYVDLGRVEGKIPPNEQVPTETYNHGDRIKCFVVVQVNIDSPACQNWIARILYAITIFIVELRAADRCETCGVSSGAGRHSGCHQQ